MLTNQEILEEYTKNLLDPSYGIEAYLETHDKTQEANVPVQLLPSKKKFICRYKKNKLKTSIFF